MCIIFQKYTNEYKSMLYLLVRHFFIDMYTYYICRYRTLHAFTCAISLNADMQNLLYGRKDLGIRFAEISTNHHTKMAMWHYIKS